MVQLQSFLQHFEVDILEAGVENKFVSSEATHFQELFGHLKVSYIEEDTREK